MSRDSYKVFHTITTRWADNDVYGHVNNVVYYSWFDTAVNAHLIGTGVLDLAGGAVIGLVVETGCRYIKPLAFPQTVTAGIRTVHIGTTSVRYEIGVFAGDDDAAAAEGFLVHVYVDRLSRRPVPVPPPLRKVLDALSVHRG